MAYQDLHESNLNTKAKHTPESKHDSASCHVQSPSSPISRSPSNPPASKSGTISSSTINGYCNSASSCGSRTVGGTKVIVFGAGTVWVVDIGRGPSDSELLTSERISSIALGSVRRSSSSSIICHLMTWEWIRRDRRDRTYDIEFNLLGRSQVDDLQFLSFREIPLRQSFCELSYPFLGLSSCRLMLSTQV